jgi:SPP1 family predicted phage head-tail adaptor
MAGSLLMLDTIDAGTLTQLVSIYQFTESADSHGYGEAIPSQVLFHKVWAGIETQSGREFFRASQVYPTLTHLVTIRYLRGLTPKMKIVFGGRALNILAVIDVGALGIKMQVPCAEAV